MDVTRGVSAVLGVCSVTALMIAAAPPASAHDGSDASRYGIVNRGDNFHPSWGGPEDDDYNGIKVFLSSPRHANSGNRGECRNPGYEENVNGRRFGWYAANGSWYFGNYEPDSQYRNIHGRGYLARLSRNTRDDGWRANRSFARNWGTDVNIVTHTNAAGGGCGSSASYLLTMYHHANDENLAHSLGLRLNPDVPSGWNHSSDESWLGFSLGELFTNATYGDAYVELQFHDNQVTQEWIYDYTFDTAFQYGRAIDIYLDYPN